MFYFTNLASLSQVHRTNWLVFNSHSPVRSTKVTFNWPHQCSTYNSYPHITHVGPQFPDKHSLRVTCAAASPYGSYLKYPSGSATPKC